MMRRSHALPFVLWIALSLSGGCTWYSMTPKERSGPPPRNAPRALNTLVLGEPRDAVLDCARQECNHWYRLDIPRPGTLAIEVETHPEGERTAVRLVVREIASAPLAQTMGGASNTLEVSVPVGPGLFMVLVQGGGKRLPYTVEATLSESR